VAALGPSGGTRAMPPGRAGRIGAASGCPGDSVSEPSLGICGTFVCCAGLHISPHCPTTASTVLLSITALTMQLAG